MCRLFSQLSTQPRRAERALVGGEQTLIAQSRENPDGWGLGMLTPTGPVLHKAMTPAWDDGRFLKRAQHACARALVAHVRKATVGPVRTENAHPFLLDGWLFAHNGSLFGFDALRARMEAQTRPGLRARVQGDTDSELLFAYLLSALRPNMAPATAARRLRDATGRLFSWAHQLGLEPPKVSYVLTDGSILFAQRGGMELHLSAGVGVLKVASQPTDSRRWLAIPEGNLVVGTAQQILLCLPPPPAFQVSWPHPMKPPPARPNVATLAA